MASSRAVDVISMMVAAVRADRVWFRTEARKTVPWNQAMLIDAAACAIREKALLDARLAVTEAEKRGGGA